MGCLCSVASDINYSVSLTFQEIRKEIEKVKNRSAVHYSGECGHCDINEAIDQALQVIDKHLNEGDVSSQANR